MPTVVRMDIFIPIFCTCFAMSLFTMRGRMRRIILPILSLQAILIVNNQLSSIDCKSCYIFDPTDLHQLSLRAIDRYGNDTASVVSFIVNDLKSNEELNPHISLDQEWIFNNAGGAMGAMYIIHASNLHFHALTSHDNLLNHP